MSEQADSSPSAASDAGGAMILVVDPDPISRSQAEELEDDLDRQLIAIDSMDFDADANEEVIEAGVYILCWDLSIRCGADLLELVRGDPRLSGKTVLVAFEAPTLAKLRTALALGADGVCMKPWSAEEIARQLSRIASAAAEQAA